MIGGFFTNAYDSRNGNHAWPIKIPMHMIRGTETTLGQSNYGKGLLLSFSNFCFRNSNGLFILPFLILSKNFLRTPPNPEATAAEAHNVDKDRSVEGWLILLQPSF